MLDDIVSILPQMMEPLLVTVTLFAFTLLFSLPLGLLVAFGRMSRIRPIRWIMQVYLLVMRGTPLMLQLIFFWFGLGLGSNGFTRLQTAIIAFSLNYAAYFAEIYRGGIESIPIGQREAANVLGFSKSQTFFRIIMPQVVKKILPPMGNEFMTLVKDTSLAQVIAVVEITNMASKIQVLMVSILPIVVAGIFYLLMNAIVSKGFSLAEKKLSYYR
ncbi:MAG TPA: amino acid ABC transporter permease [Firmicutes bacterium]|nr:amino acid ABC transporter permease [Bacillota bacterium]